MANNEGGIASATGLMGILVGFLVVGVIGVYIGDQMLTSASLDANDTLYTSQQAIVETFELGVTLAKVIIIVSIAAIIFVMLQKTGLVPSFNQKGGEY